MEVRFDDRRRGQSFSFSDLHGVVEARSLDEVVPAFQQVEDRVAAGLWAAGFVSYEAAPAFDRALTVRENGLEDAQIPLLWFALFDTRVEPGPAQGGRYELTPWGEVEDPDRYRRSMARIRSHIEAGDTYQVNYTYRQSARFRGDPRGFYGDLLTAQTASYGAYLDTGQYQILSASPELFFQQQDGRIICRPMKGTSARGRWAEEDQALVEALRSSEKERAENLMIVDLIRNDLGRIARFGTVQVDALFEVEQYETVWQLVSNVSAEMRPGTGTVDLFRALFPCGSVTGAPKVRTMEIIAELEAVPRGVYCGAIGFLAPPGSQGPAASFSVAIRTVTIDRDSGIANYGIGGGITIDSEVDQEYAETRTKARVLVRKAADFSIFETLRWEAGRGYFWLDQHLDRLQASASYCGYRFDRADLTKQLLTAAAGITSELARVRISIDEEGRASITVDHLEETDEPMEIAVDSVPVDPADWRLYHKTSLRRRYEQARLRHPEAGDVLMINTRGEITESTVSNVIVRLDGEWVTPPLASGCLPGVMRRVMLEDGEISEKPIAVSDLARAEAVALINSVRLRVPVVLTRRESEHDANGGGR